MASLITVPTHKVGGVLMQLPMAHVIGITTVGNGPAILMRSDDDILPADKQPMMIYVYEMDANEALPIIPSSDFFGVASSGTKCWAVFRYNGG
jgi:hypothetical protein